MRGLMLFFWVFLGVFPPIFELFELDVVCVNYLDFEAFHGTAVWRARLQHGRVGIRSAASKSNSALE